VPLKIFIIVKVSRRSSIKLNSVPTIAIETAELKLKIAMGRIKAFFSKVTDKLCCSLSSKAYIESTVILKVISLIVLTDLFTNSIFTNLVVMFLETKFRKFSHSDAVIMQKERYFVFG
jgi:hypothetical protein